MDIKDTFLYQSIRDSGKQRFMTIGLIYPLLLLVVFIIFTRIVILEAIKGFPGGIIVALAAIFAVLSGILAYSNLRYLFYGYRIYRNPSRAQFLSLWEGKETFEQICMDVEKEKDMSLISGITNVTITKSFLYVKQKGYFELYRLEHIKSISFGNGRAKVLSFTDSQGYNRELTYAWDDEAIPKLMKIVGLE